MSGFRHFIIKTAEVMMILVVILMTLAIAVSGGGTGYAMMGAVGMILGAIVGAVVGFLTAAVIAAYFFLLAEIAENTRRGA